jgi:hypothetical protein
MVCFRYIIANSLHEGDNEDNDNVLSSSLVHVFGTTIYVDEMKEYGELVPVPLASRSNAWVCASSFAAIADSNPAVAMDVCLF